MSQETNWTFHPDDEDKAARWTTEWSDPIYIAIWPTFKEDGTCRFAYGWYTTEDDYCEYEWINGYYSSSKEAQEAAEAFLQKHETPEDFI